MQRKTWIKLAVAALCVSVPVIAWAHACHDFTRRVVRPPAGTAQVTKANVIASQDDLIVKVDAPDGKLRIGDETTFRVYLFNTSDVEIKNVSLDVCTNNCFKAEAKPGGDWQGFPTLKPMDKGGRKEYFEVTLKRKEGVPDGKYKIELCLFDPKNQARQIRFTPLLRPILSRFKGLEISRPGSDAFLRPSPLLRVISSNPAIL